MSSVAVVTVGDGPSGLVEGLERLHGPVTVVRRCAALSELLAACQSGLARAAVIAADTQELTATLVDRLAAVGVAVVALAQEPGEVARLSGLGVVVASPAAPAEVLAARICAAAAAGVHASPGGYAHGPAPLPAQAPVGAVGHPGPADGGRAAALALAQDPAEDGHRAAAEGSGPTVVAVWGPTGAPGRTTVAMNMAAELAASGRSVVLVDADSYGASVAASLGLLDESASLAHACRLADAGSLTAATLEKVAQRVVFAGGSLRLLSGLTRADRWPELRPAAVERVLAVCREIAQVTVVDCGFSLENDEELSYDTLVPRRNGATLAVLAAADTIFAVGAADAVGIPRLIRAVGDLAAAGTTAQTVVLLNKVRRSAFGGQGERSLVAAWERFGPEQTIGHFLPWDGDVLDKALLSGRLLIEAAPDSALRKSIAGVVCAPVQRSRRTAVSKTTAKAKNKG
ncbi:AAA family ATPase [Arthrobacter sp. 35W]|uniref:AAA family ATPase n=1 Tax=Arthrobacter sp. 35W TaxID=1132441 RepID=UPI000414F4D7|nr:P-loop NTPase [Arthrobacter sp. 35W]